MRAVSHSITTRTQGTTLQRGFRSPSTLHADPALGRRAIGLTPTFMVVMSLPVLGATRGRR